MDIQPRKPEFNKGKAKSKKAKGPLSVILNIQNQEVEVEQSQIKEIAQKFAEIAYSLGETNDPKEYTEKMTDTLFKAWKKVEKKQKEK